MARIAKRLLSIALCGTLWSGTAISVGATPAQNKSPRQISSLDLAKDNLSHVAASAADIKAVLIKDGGLMVELKRWVAQDATDHGQLIDDRDLTNDAIFDRLENDVEFRSVATLLLQRYGYLVAQVNPNSEAGREQVLLMQERVKWISQEEEEARLQAQQQMAQTIQRTRLCQNSQSDCSQQPAPKLPTQPSQTPGQETQPQIPLRSNPTGPYLPSPPDQSTQPLETAQLVQTGQGIPGDFSQLGGGSLGLFPGLGNGGIGTSSTGALSTSSATGDQQTDSSASRAGSSFRNGMLAGSNGEASLFSAIEQSSIDQDETNPYQSQRAPGRLPSSSALDRQLTNRIRNSSEPAEMVAAANPYRDIPSLYDMYMQAVPRPTAPKRFGIEVFENGMQDPDLIPTDLPAGPDYVVGPGDGLSIDLWGGVSRKIYRTVDREGRISIPEVGPLLVSGKSLADVQQNLQQAVRTQFRDESADVSLGRLRTIRVYEVGEVVNPGPYDVSSLSTPLNVLFVAGGPTPQGSMRLVKHFRNNQLVETVDLYDLLLHGVRTGIDRLENGDTILVPTTGPQVTLEGMVRRPAIYELRDEKNLSSVLELAGGLLPTAAVRHIEVQRLVAHEKRTMLSLEIPDAGDTSQVTSKLDSFTVQDGDEIRIFPIASGNEDAVYLDGHVVRPGRYSYHSNMRVTDVVASYQDLLPEPAAKYAEIIRLNAPDLHPSVQSFDLADALANPAQAPVLQPMDTVRIFSRFDFENPPSISVLGEVRSPGTYRTTGEIHLADAVHLAGGLSPDAQTGDAQVFRYLPDGKSKIFSVNLTTALSGDPTENIILQPRDRLLIHRNADAVQPATVYVQGDVVKPGRYPLSTNMKLADLILVGGGLKPSADAQTVDITHYQWAGSDQLKGQTEQVSLSAALAGDPKSDLALHNGDVVAVRQLPGWDDLGASIVVKGEVQHPGTFGIRPGEKLSSVLQRAGGFTSGAYPYGAVLQRTQVRELESQSQNAMILRVKEAQSNLELTPGGTPQQQQARELTLQQYQTTLEQLTTNPPVGRVAVRISPNISQWRNTPSDIEVRAGDTLVIPKKPSYVMVTGQVFNPTAVSYRPGKSARWYLSQSGGPTQLANKKAIFVIRADGSVVGGARTNLLLGDSYNVVLLPGDTLVVPEKAIGGGPNWANLFTAAQVSSAVVSTLFISLHY